MMGRQDEPGQLFYRVNVDRHIPADHLLRRIEAALDLREIRGVLAPYYAGIGRPSLTDRHVERLQDELGAKMIGHGPAHDATAEGIQHDGQVDEAGRGRHEGDVGDPELVGTDGG